MQFFTGRSAYDKLVQNLYKSPQERDALIAELRGGSLRPTQAVALFLHTDPAIRTVGSDSLLAKADVASLIDIIDRGVANPAARNHIARLWPRLGPEIGQRLTDSLLNDKNPIRRRQAWEIVVLLSGEWRHRYLERAMTDAPAALRLPVLQRLLIERPAIQQIEMLLKFAMDDDQRVAAAALEAVSRMHDPRILELMVDRLARGDGTMREMARNWLRTAARENPTELRKRMIELLAAGEEATRHACVDIVLSSGDREEVLMEILLFCRNLVGWLRTRILETLRSFGEMVFKPACALLAHPDAEIRTAALVLAENFNDPRLVGPLSEMLHDPDWWLRISACDSLGRLRDERAVPALVEALGDPDTRWAAIDALAQIGSSVALKPLVALLQDTRPEIRLELVRAFSRFTDARLVPLLQQVKERDGSSEVRTRASEVLRDMQSRLQMTVEEAEHGTAAVLASSMAKPIDRLLAGIREQDCSDLHITVGEPPFVRSNGKLERMGAMAPLSAASTEQAVFSLLSDRQAATLREKGELDFCYAIPEVGRYRVNAFHQRLGWCAAFRVIPNLPPTFASLRIPGRLTELLDYHQGIILISGPAGCGKSTTLAALVNLINETKADHVITLEDPIEFVHPVKGSLVNQREVGTHTNSFSRALRAALREDPDVIIVGEMRDAETIRLALTAAETGHLVIGTLHTTSAYGTVDRVIKSFPPEEQSQVRMALSESMKYVVSQSLLPRRDGKGRVAMFEVLKGTTPVATLIRDNKLHQIPTMMQLGRQAGMQTVDQALLELVQGGLITGETAWRRADKPEDFESFCDPIFLRDSGVDTEAKTQEVEKPPSPGPRTEPGRPAQSPTQSGLREPGRPASPPSQSGLRTLPGAGRGK